VAVFILPKDNSTDFIKRVIGLPGDRIQMIDGILNINGEPVKREFVRDVQSDCAGRVQTFKEYMETLPNGVRHVIHELSDNADADNTGVFEVPANNYFMMGDNRDCSQDSRYQAAVGYVPLENFVGRAEIRWFSLEDASFWQFWKWPFALRYDRLFTGIE
jgi:signal peptidase I